MTLLAGVYSRHSDNPVSDALCDAIKAALSRYPNEQLQFFRDERCFLVKADAGAYGDQAFRIDSSGVSFMVGEPLLAHAQPSRRSRAVDLNELHNAFARNDSEPLTRARGVFCAAHYRPGSAALTLVTDKLGIRPMYYWLSERYVIFATALRILEDVQDVPKVMDVRGVTELYSLEYPLSDRTPYSSVSLLKAAEIVRVTGEPSFRQQYWRWDDIQSSGRPTDELTEDVYRKFVDAVAIRSGTDSTTAAFLSGGLDSRTIVTALVQRGLRVHTFNFSILGAQDQVFGAEFAHRLDTTHTERPLTLGRQVSAKFIADILNAPTDDLNQLAERPGLVWSGDGGS